MNRNNMKQQNQDRAAEKNIPGEPAKKAARQLENKLNIWQDALSGLEEIEARFSENGPNDIKSAEEYLRKYLSRD